jgi:hypothetical protein
MKILRTVFLLTMVTVLFGQEPNSTQPPVSVTGYVRDSGCVYRFHEVVKPLPDGCVQACVRAGSPLVILTKDEQVYHPISAEIPDVDVRRKLLPFAGKLVKITGHVYSRDGSNAISVEHIEEVKE